MTQAFINELSLFPVYPVCEWVLRPASVEDIATLVSMRIQLFQSIQTQPQEELNQLALNSWAYFSQSIPSGAYRAWLAETPRGIVATGGVVVHHSVPTLRNPCGREGHIVGMFTLPEWRGQGIARTIIETILTFLREEHIPICTLRATTSGRPLYERVGFENTSEMRLFLSTVSPAE